MPENALFAPKAAETERIVLQPDTQPWPRCQAVTAGRFASGESGVGRAGRGPAREALVWRPGYGGSRDPVSSGRLFLLDQNPT